MVASRRKVNPPRRWASAGYKNYPPRDAPALVTVNVMSASVIITVNPDAVVMTPGPMARPPIRAHAVIPVPRPVVVIPAIAEFDINPDRSRSGRNHCPRAKERGQQNSKFIFHSGFP